MDYENFIPEAMDMASAWNIDEENFLGVVFDQAHRMCGQNLEPSTDLPHHSPYAALRF